MELRFKKRRLGSGIHKNISTFRVFKHGTFPFFTKSLRSVATSLISKTSGYFFKTYNVDMTVRGMGMQRGWREITSRDHLNHDKSCCI